jgi:Flp pilus assembly protein TadG
MWKCLSALRENRSGNAMMLTALAMPVLVGATGYGVDTAQWYMWKRELQHSVDQAAIGGAYARAYGATGNYQTRALQEFNANQALTADFTATPSISLTNYSGGTNNAVLVTATATRRLPFSGSLFDSAATIAVSATAKFAAGGTYSACFVALRETGTAFSVGGNATVRANCGLGALSCDANALVIDGNANVTTTAITTCGTADVPPNLQGLVSEGVTTLEDAYADLAIPEPTNATPNRTIACTGTGRNRIARPQPGRYVGGITVSCATTFASGIYFVDGGRLDLTYNASVVGNNVLFVLMNGATLQLGGMGNAAAVQLSPMTKAQLEALGYSSTTADALSKMLIVQDPDTNTNEVSMQINGNATITMSGVMYLPKGNVQINGNARSASNLCFQISAYTLDIRGNAYLDTLCSAEQTTSIGNAAASVNLVG